MPKYGVKLPVTGHAYVEVEVPEGATWADVVAAAHNEVEIADISDLEFEDGDGVRIKPLEGAPPVRRTS